MEIGGTYGEKKIGNLKNRNAVASTGPVLDFTPRFIVGFTDSVRSVVHL
jgi:hypothetical protein